MDDAARGPVSELARGGGSVTKLLYGDPGGPGDDGLSLVWARFGANYRLPRHSHSVDCLYYVLAGEIRMGNRVVKAGDGFFAPADAPYGYVAGPEGVHRADLERGQMLEPTAVAPQRAACAVGHRQEGRRALRDLLERDRKIVVIADGAQALGGEDDVRCDLDERVAFVRRLVGVDDNVEAAGARGGADRQDEVRETVVGKHRIG